MKKIISKIILNAFKKMKLGFSQKQINNLIEIPPSGKMGDYAFPCFSLSKKLKKNPSDIASEIKSKITKLPSSLEKIQIS